MAGSWILREDGSGTRAVFAESLAGLGVETARLRVQIALPSNEAVRRTVEQGAGAAALSLAVCAESIAAGRLVRVKLKLPKRQFHAVQHVDHYRSRIVTAFLNSMDKRLKESLGLPGHRAHSQL